jgi:fibronectin-binding autotransporter adhesin
MSKNFRRQIKSVRTSRSTAARAITAASAAVALASWSAARADTYGNLWKSDGNQANLNSSTAWIDETIGGSNSPPPGSNDIAQFDSFTNLSSPTTFTLGGSTNWLGVSVLNPGAAVTIDDVGNESNDVLTLGASGIYVGSQTLTINDYVSLNTSETWTVNSGQNLSVNGNINGNSNTLSFAGAGVTTLTAANSSPSAIALAGGTVDLDYSSGAVGSNIVSSSAVLQLGGGGLVMNNGASSASPSQTFASTANGTTGESVITLSSTGTGVPTLNLGTLSFTARSAPIVFNGLAAENGLGTTSTAQGTVTVTTNTVGGIIAQGNSSAVTPGDFATAGLYDWAAVLNNTSGTATSATNSGIVVGGSAIPGFYTIDTTGEPTTNAQVDVQGSLTNSSTTNVFSMRFNTATADAVQVTSGALSVGGILVTPSVGANNDSFTTTGTAFIDPSRANSGTVDYDTVIWQNDSQSILQFSGVFENGKSGSASIVLAGTSSVLISGANTNTAQDYFYNGVGIITSDNALGAVSNAQAANIEGGAIIGTGTFSLDNGAGNNKRPINLVGVGGTLGAAGGNTLTVDGVISGSGALEVGYGTLPGTGTNTANAAIAGNGTLLLSAANTYTGPTSVNAGLLRVDGSIGSTASFTVAGGAGLAGVATISGNVVLGPGALLIVGDPGSVGTVTAPSMSLGAGDTADYAFGAGINSLVNLTGSSGLSLSSLGFNLYSAGTTNSLITNGTYDLFSASNAASLNTSGLSVLNPGVNTQTDTNLGYSFSTAGTFVTVTVSGGSVASTWNKSSGGSWGTSSDWTSGIPGLPGDTADFGTALTGNGNVTLDGNRTVGNVIFNDFAASYTLIPGSGGTLTINGGINNGNITDLAGAHTFGVPILLNSNTTITVNNPGDSLAFTGAIGGTAGVTAAGAGTVIFTNSSNTYAGATTINAAATLELGSGAAVGSLPATTILADGGTLEFGSSANSTFSLVISGSGGVTQSGTGEVLLTGSNNYTGTTNLNAGALQIGNLTAIGSGIVNFSGNAVLDLNGNSITLSSLSGSNGVVDNVSAGGTVTLTINNGGTTTFGGVIQNTTGTLSLIKSGSGTLDLTGVTTFTGSTTLSAGRLVLSNTNALGSTSAVTVLSQLAVEASNAVNPAATLSVNTGSGGQVQLGSGVTLASPIIVSGGSSQFIDVPNGSATASGNISVATGGTQYRPGTTGGTLFLTGASTEGNDQYAIITGGDVVYAGTGSLTVTTDTNTFSMQIGRSTGAVVLTVQDNASISSISTQPGGGIGMSIGSNTASSADENSAATLNINGGSVTTGTGEFNLNGDYSSTSTVALNLNGGDLTVGSLVDTTGNTAFMFLNGGTLTAAANDNTNGSALFFPAFNNLTVAVEGGGAIINDGGFNITVAATLQDEGGGLTKLGNGTLTLTGANGYSGPTIINSGTLQVDDGGTTGQIGGGPVTDNGALAFDRSDTGYNVGNNISGSGAVVQMGTGATTLSGSNSYTGGTNIKAGTLTIAATNALPTGGNVINNGTLDIEANSVSGNISGTGTLLIGVNSASTLKLNDSSGASTVGTLTINTNSSLDLANNALFINYGAVGGADPVAAIASYLSAAYSAAGGHWSSGTIFSSSVASADTTQSKRIYAIGYADGSDGLTTSAPSGEVEILPTLAGDAKLQGNVVFGDFQVLAQYFGKSGSWDEGNFTYGATVSFGDFQQLAQDFGSNTSGLTDAEVASLNSFAAQFGDTLVANSDGVGFQIVSVPEPASLGLLAAAGFGLLSRRRRRTAR